MSDRVDFYTGQLVTQQDMDLPFDYLEQSQWDVARDMGFYGIISGYDVVESSPNAFTVEVASGAAYSGEGKRLVVANDQTLDVSVDRDLNDTAVLTNGTQRYISVIVTPDRTLDDVRPDINQFPVYYRRYEIAKVEVIMGGEAATPQPPVVPDESILLCDILLSYGQSTVTNGDLDFSRCTYMFSYEYASTVQQYATISLALQSLADIITNNTPAWSTILASYGGSATWANGSQWLPSPGTTPLNTAVETYIVGALRASTNPSGAHLMGVFQSAYQSPTVPTLASGTLFARLESMRDAANIYVGALGSWPAGDNATNPADSVTDALTKVVANIAARASATDQGVLRMGLHGTSFGLASWQALGASTVYGAFVGLNAATGTYDGASYIGAKASGALVAGTVRSQLDALDTRVTSLENIPYATYYQHPTPSTSTSPTYTAIGTSFTQIAVVVFGSPTEEVVVDDIVEIRFTATATATTTDGLVVLSVQQPSDGSPVDITGARQLVKAGSTVPISLNATFKVTEAGVLTVFARGAKKVLGGNMTIDEAYRLECVRIRPS